MDFIKTLNLGTTAELLIIVAICWVVTQALKQTGISNHWMPWISMVTGVIAGITSGLIQGDAHYLALAVLGLLIGGFSAGLFDGFKAPFQAYQTNKSTNDTPETPVQWQPSSAQLNESAKDEGSVPKDANQ